MLEQKHRVCESVSEPAALAVLQRLRWDLSERGCASSEFCDFTEGGGVCRILWACVHVRSPGMCTVLGLKDKG